MFAASLIGIGSTLAAAFAFGLMGVGAWWNHDSASALTALWTVAGAVAVAAALVPPAYWSGRAVFGAAPSSPGRPSPFWLVPFVGYPVFILFGWLAHARGVAQLILGPIALIGTACLSVAFIAWLVRRLGPPLTPLRSWGHFSVGLTAMPLAAMFVEFVALLPLLFLLGVWLLSSPQGQAWVVGLEQSSMDPEAALQSMGELLKSPLVLLAVYGYVGLAIPFLEELIKTMAVWPFLRRGLAADEAFLGGALGGAGYALFEALFLTQPGETWVGTTFARVGASLLHIFTAALTSYGLMRAFRKRRPGLAVVTFVAAMTMHALWNMAAITIGISSIPFGATASPPAGNSNGLVALLLLGLTAVSAVGLVAPWRRLRALEAEQG
ncbi:MAG TPA: PrsW family glutamic-type intramembrane protease [Anaerolineales bacterium]|nr:PrsW family glutamic-type intramembrane protease [Anaerolineales bacterium]